MRRLTVTIVEEHEALHPCLPWKQSRHFPDRYRRIFLADEVSVHDRFFHLRVAALDRRLSRESQHTQSMAEDRRVSFQDDGNPQDACRTLSAGCAWNPVLAQVVLARAHWRIIVVNGQAVRREEGEGRTGLLCCGG